MRMHAPRQCRCTAVYDAQGEFSVRWDDPELAVDWPISDPIVSEKDRRAPLLRDVRDRLIRYSA